MTAKDLVPLMEWQSCHHRDPTIEFACKTTQEAHAAVETVRAFWGATNVRALTKRRGPGVYRAVVRVESRSLTVVYHKMTREELQP